MEGDRDSETHIYGIDTPYSPPPSPNIYPVFKHEGVESQKLCTHKHTTIKMEKEGRRMLFCSVCKVKSSPAQQSP